MGQLDLIRFWLLTLLLACFSKQSETLLSYAIILDVNYSESIVSYSGNSVFAKAAECQRGRVIGAFM